MYPRSDGVDGRSPSLIYINKIVFVCLCVCVSVCLFNPKFLLGKCPNMNMLYTNRSTIYLGRTTLQKEICPDNCSDDIVRTPDTGRSKPTKNGLFLEVFGKFDTFPDTVFITNFNRG